MYIGAPYVTVPTGWGTTNLAKWLLWEDPLMAHLSPQVSDRDMIKHYRQLASALDRRIGAAMRGTGGNGRKGKNSIRGGASSGEEARWAHPLAFPAALAKALARKLAFRRDLQDAYGAKNRLAMARLIGYNLKSTRKGFGQSIFSRANTMWGHSANNIVEPLESGSSEISNTTMTALREMHADNSSLGAKTGNSDDLGGGGELGALLASLVKIQHLHRGMWRAHYKPHGWEVIEGRYGTLRARLEGIGDLIHALLEGRINSIEELERPPAVQSWPPRVYNAEIYQLPLMCWARAVTPAMPSIKPDGACPL